MNAVVSVCIFGAIAMVAVAAPTLNEGVEPQHPTENVLSGNPEFVRQKRSQYGPPSYAAPCASPYPISAAVAPLPPSYLPLHGAYAGGGVPHSYGGSYGYGAPHYRADDMGDDHENFPDMENMMTEHFPMARYGGYGPLPGAHGLPTFGPAVATGPAYGYFPNANTGGCNVPLLLSCSPSIVPGRLVKSGYGGYGGAPVNAYRGVDEGHLEAQNEHAHHEEHEAAHEHLAPVSDASHPTSTHQ